MSVPFVAVCILLSALHSSELVAAQSSYSQWTKTAFASLSSSSPPQLSFSGGNTVLLPSLGGNANGTPFTSVTGVNVTVNAATNLAYPFTGNTFNSHTYQDVDSGIDVFAGGVVTFRIPQGASTNTWCFEVGRQLAGTSACTGPAGYAFDYWNDHYCAPANTNNSPCGQSKCNNSMINGAWNTNETPIPTNQLLPGSPDRSVRGTSLSFTYARSGALMARVGAHGQSNQAANDNPNSPVNEYFSAFDNVGNCPALVTPATQTSGITNSYVVPVSGRLYFAIWRWNFYPNWANGSIWLLVDYLAPIQLAVSSPNSTVPVIVTQTSSGFPATVALPNNVSSVSIQGLLPVENITVPSYTPSTATTIFYNSTKYTWSGPNNQVTAGGAYAQNGSVDGIGPWLSAYNPIAVALSNALGSGTIGVDMSMILASNTYGGIFPATRQNLLLNAYYQQYYPPCSNDYDCEYDTAINVFEGGSLTFTASATQTWCYQADWGANYAYCSNAAGYSATPYTAWNGCSGSFGYLYSNNSQLQWGPTGNPNNNYDNSGCNSDSTLQGPVGAVIFRIGVDTTAMQNVGVFPVEYHSFDYYFAFPSSVNATSGTLSYTVTAPNTGRLYLAFFGPGSPYYLVSGGISVSVSYTPPPGLAFSATWSPPTSAPQPYYFAVPTANTPSALVSSGMLPANNPRYYQLPGTFSTTTAYTVTFWIYQTVSNQTVTAGGTNAAAVNMSPSPLVLIILIIIVLINL